MPFKETYQQRQSLKTLMFRHVSDLISEKATVKFHARTLLVTVLSLWLPYIPVLNDVHKICIQGFLQERIPEKIHLVKWMTDIDPLESFLVEAVNDGRTNKVRCQCYWLSWWNFISGIKHNQLLIVAGFTVLKHTLE